MQNEKVQQYNNNQIWYEEKKIPYRHKEENRFEEEIEIEKENRTNEVK